MIRTIKSNFDKHVFRRLYLCTYVHKYLFINLQKNKNIYI